MATKSSGRAERLSSASPYEQTFKTRHRGRGRPEGEGAPVFVAEGVDPVIVAVAKRRAYAVIHERYKEEMAEVFRKEVKVLRARGLTVVARDAGVALKLGDNRKAS